LLLLAALVVPLLIALAAIVLLLLARQGGLEPFRVPSDGRSTVDSTDAVKRGRYLATLGNCAGCHTTRGGTAFAGGRAFPTDHGIVYSTNLTPHAAHGIGSWSVAEFRHAMRHGVSRNGLLSPVFPYASFRHLADEDLDALLAFLRTVPASDAPRKANRLRFPANLPGSMLVWRLLYYRPASGRVPADATLARGAELVNGIGHCASCHSPRGAFGSPSSGAGLWVARISGWFAPGLHGEGLERFGKGDVARYLRGDAPDAIGAYGLMADVIARNLQHLTDGDARAIEEYLRSLPAPPRRRAPWQRSRASAESLASGAELYARHCADCHGDAGGTGERVDTRYPSLRASAAIAQPDPINLVRLVRFGAVAPTTPANPAPYTMPPFANALTDEEIALLVNWLRLQYDADAVPVSADEIRAIGGGAE